MAGHVQAWSADDLLFYMHTWFNMTNSSAGVFSQERIPRRTARSWPPLFHLGPDSPTAIGFLSFLSSTKLSGTAAKLKNCWQSANLPASSPHSILIHYSHWNFRSHQSHLRGSLPRWWKHSCTMCTYKLKINEETCLKIDSSYPRV